MNDGDEVKSKIPQIFVQELLKQMSFEMLNVLIKINGSWSSCSKCQRKLENLFNMRKAWLALQMSRVFVSRDMKTTYFTDGSNCHYADVWEQGSGGAGTCGFGRGSYYAIHYTLAIFIPKWIVASTPSTPGYKKNTCLKKYGIRTVK